MFNVPSTEHMIPFSDSDRHHSLDPCHSGDRLRTGFTLVELVVSLVLLASLLVSMLSAFRVHQRQAMNAVRHQAASQAIEPLLGEWLTGDGQVPRRASGRIRWEGQNWLWTCRPGRQQRLSKRASIEFVRLSVYSIGDPAHGSEPVLRLDLMRALDSPATGKHGVP